MRMSEASDTDALIGKSKPSEKNGKVSELELLEKQVLAETQAALDIKRIKDALFQGSSEESTAASVDLTKEPKMKVSNETSAELQSTPPSSMSIALAAGSAVGLTSLIALQVPILSLGAFAATTFIASRDPIKDEDFIEGDLSGPISRTVGRATLTSVEKSKPTLKAVARAVVASNEVEELREQCKELQEENARLQLKLDRIDAVDKQSKGYTMTQLKEMAKKDDIKIGGTKAQLMMRLVEADVLVLNGF